MQMPCPDVGAGKVTETHKCKRISEPRRGCMWIFKRWEEFVSGMSFDLDLDEHFHSFIFAYFLDWGQWRFTKHMLSLGNLRSVMAKAFLSFLYVCTIFIWTSLVCQLLYIHDICSDWASNKVRSILDIKTTSVTEHEWAFERCNKIIFLFHFVKIWQHLQHLCCVWCKSTMNNNDI